MARESGYIIDSSPSLEQFPCSRLTPFLLYVFPAVLRKGRPQTHIVTDPGRRPVLFHFRISFR
jgi:hypothetical protein